MFDIFLAIFGIPYYTTKYVSEVKAHQTFESERKIRINWEQGKYKELAPTYDEYKALEKLAFYNTDKAKAEVEDALIRVFGINYNTVIANTYKINTCGISHSPMAGNFKSWLFELLLAKRGKIDQYLPFGYELGSSDGFLDINILLCHEIERYIHDSGHTEMKLGSSRSLSELHNLDYSFTLNVMRWISPIDTDRSHRLW